MKPKTKKVAKLSEAQQILQDLSLQEISSWLHQFFSVNKEAEIQFLHQFSKQNTNFQVNDIDPLISKSFTSVVGKRKKIELNELKKIIQFVEQSLEPVFNYIQTIVRDAEAYLFLEEISKVFQTKNYSYTIPGTRFQKLELQIIDKFSLMLNNVQERDLWENALNLLHNKLFDLKSDNNRNLLIQYLYHLNKNGSHEQKNYISRQISENLITLIKEKKKIFTRLRF